MKEKSKKIIIKMFLGALTVLGLSFTSPQQAKAINVSDEGELNSAISEGESTITITDDITVKSDIIVKDDLTLTVSSGKTLTLGKNQETGASCHIDIAKNKKLTINGPGKILVATTTAAKYENGKYKGVGAVIIGPDGSLTLKSNIEISGGIEKDFDISPEYGLVTLNSGATLNFMSGKLHNYRTGITAHNGGTITIGTTTTTPELYSFSANAIRFGVISTDDPGLGSKTFAPSTLTINQAKITDYGKNGVIITGNESSNQTNKAQPITVNINKTYFEPNNNNGSHGLWITQSATLASGTGTMTNSEVYNAEFGIAAGTSGLKLTNDSFHGNKTGIYNTSSGLTVTNCTVKDVKFEENCGKDGDGNNTTIAYTFPAIINLLKKGTSPSGSAF